MAYTKEMLIEENCGFDREFGINETDVRKVNKALTVIEATRDINNPQAGDVIQYTNKWGEYFPKAHIEYTEAEGRCGGNVCEYAGTYLSVDNGKVFCNSSGGTWTNIDLSKLKYIGKAKRHFWFFGHCGARANGGVYFTAEVNLWEYKDPEWRSKYTTKDYERYFITYRHKPDESGYRWFVSKNGLSHRAFTTREDKDAWLKTFRGVKKGNIVWAWKEVKHGNITPNEYDSLDLPEDTMMMNGLRKCKRYYDEKNHIIHTYFVWYWDEPGNFTDYAMKQNEIRKKYEIDWRERRKEFELARREIA